MAPWVFLFGLTMSCILMWGAGPETPHDTLHDIWRSWQDPLHYTWRSEQGMVSDKALRRAVEQFVRMNTQLQEDQEEQLLESWTPWRGGKTWTVPQPAKAGESESRCGPVGWKVLAEAARMQDL
ncbi:hypothetical protein mRhiFer1_009663 [Rhinolophus ferrumequinum]|uniref:Uncharacterized protein n=1 Tax=Rhinolophus ferrumequinum TaxID=59479 RepID=A0A7J7R665_RHIFE|nr:hypothetical protein mRhiFer1_009663 [Rhinolophus ferrumequinum]